MKKILYAGAEVMPFAATGGLGDVLGSLPAAVKRKNPDCDVRVVMPLYGQIKAEWRDKMTFVKYLMVPLAWRSLYCGIFSIEKDGVTFYFLDNEYYFKRNALYGSYDDAERFAFFSVAILEMMRVLNFYPDVLHANDWQTALTVIKLKRAYAERPDYKNIKAVYTIHNIEYQGVYSKEILGDVFDLRGEDANIVDYNGALNLTKGAVVCADYVTTVSPNYAKEIQTETYSCGLHHILREYAYKIDGIVNGIDYDYYNPQEDPDIPNAFYWRALSGKKKNKEALQKQFGLDVNPDVPVIAMISRMASHKGFDLVLSIFDELMQDDVQFILLGTGEPQYEAFFAESAKRYPGKASINLTYNRALSKIIYAGSDIFLMPSKSEACGLSQMIASRYGSVPVVRETGGLFDTIKPYGVDRSGNGFTFASYNAHDMLHVIREAETLFRDKDNWKTLVKKVMRVDFSWDGSADKYIACYNKLL
ncbi:MAG: glycogen synthase GlgA [Clostridia bacterium]|nr:glycogen synthase GlgA [Clostridia bacterium]